MIYSIRGKLVHRENELAVIECGGVGYACRTTLSTLAELGENGTETMLYTYLHVREDSLDLFGFASEQELRCFKMLISVSGVGPKAALAILSDVTPEKFALIVASGDSKTLTKSRGIGAKTAQRIVLELKDKIAKENIDVSQAGAVYTPAAAGESAAGEALSALMVLGYTHSEAAPVIASLDQGLPSSELIKQALKIMAQKMIR